MTLLLTSIAVALGCEVPNPAYHLSPGDLTAGKTAAGGGMGGQGGGASAGAGGGAPDAGDAAGSVDAPIEGLPVVVPSLREGLIGYWRFDEAAGPTIADSSGFNHHGNLRGLPVDGARGPGWSGRALVIPASTTQARVEVPPTPVIDGVEAVSIAAWVWIDVPLVAGPTFRIVLSRQLGATGDEHYGLGTHGTALAMFHPPVEDLSALTAPYEVALERWTHVACTVGNGVARLYIDGQLHKERAMAVMLQPDSTPILIGNNANGNGVLYEHFIGRLDEVLLYRRVLEPFEIEALAAGQQPSPSSR